MFLAELFFDLQGNDLLILIHAISLVRLYERSAERLLVIETIEVACVCAVMGVAEGTYGTAIQIGQRKWALLWNRARPFRYSRRTGITSVTSTIVPAIARA